MKKSKICGMAVAVMAACAFGGDWNGLATSATINGNIGRGVLVSDSPTGTVFFLTARHVATYGGCFRRPMTFDFECTDGTHVQRSVQDGEKRWMTIADPVLDFAWIKLHDDELPPKGLFMSAPLDSFSRTFKMVTKKGRRDVLVASYRAQEASFSKFVFAKKATNDGSVNHTCVTQEVACLNRKFAKSESGSPVYMRDDCGRSVLVGIFTVTANDCDESGFQPVCSIESKLRDNFKGFLFTRLCNCKELW